MIIMYIICQALGRRLACFQLKHKSTVYRYFTLKGYYERQLSISWIWSIIDPFFNTLVCAVVLVVFIVFISCCSFDTLNLTIVDHVSEVLTKLWSWLISAMSGEGALNYYHILSIPVYFHGLLHKRSSDKGLIHLFIKCIVNLLLNCQSPFAKFYC